MRVLRPSGRLVIGEIGYWSLWAAWRHFALARHPIWREARFRTARELRALTSGRAQSRRAAQFTILHPPWRRSQHGCVVSVQQNWRVSISETELSRFSADNRPSRLRSSSRRIPLLGACPSNRCSNPSEFDLSLDYEQSLSPLEYRSDAASAAESAGLRAQGPRFAVYRWAGAGEPGSQGDGRKPDRL